MEQCEPACPFTSDEIALEASSKLLAAGGAMATKAETLLMLVIEGQGPLAERAMDRLAAMHSGTSTKVRLDKGEQETSPTSVIDLSTVHLVAAS